MLFILPSDSIAIDPLRRILVAPSIDHLLELLRVPLTHILRVLLHLRHVALQVHLLQPLVLIVHHALAVVRLVLPVRLRGVHQLVGVPEVVLTRVV